MTRVKEIILNIVVYNNADGFELAEEIEEFLRCNGYGVTGAEF